MRKIVINISEDAEDWEIDNLIEAIDQNDCPMDGQEHIGF